MHPFTGEVLAVETIPAGPYDGLGADGGVVFYSRPGVDIRRQAGWDAPADDGWAAGVPRGGIAGDDYGRQFAFLEDGQIHEFDPQRDTDETVQSWTPPATDIEGMAFDGRRLLISTASGQLFSLLPDAQADEQLESETTVPGGALYGLASLSKPGDLAPVSVSEQEPNDSIQVAHNIDGEFHLEANSDIGDQDSNTSTEIPHVTITGRGNNTYDFFEFTVSNAGDRGIFDIDDTTGGPGFLSAAIRQQRNSAGIER